MTTGIEVNGDDIDLARVDAARAVRRLVHSLVGHEGSEQTLRELATTADRLAAELETGEHRARPDAQMMRYDKPVADGGELSCWPDCMVAGSAHPTAAGLQSHREGDEAVGRVVLGPAHEGPPGRAHGGLIASLFDEMMGFALWMELVPAYTAWLRIDYRQGIPLGEPIEFRARLKDRERRKMFLVGSASHNGVVVAEAEGLFVVPREFVDE